MVGKGWVAWVLCVVSMAALAASCSEVTSNSPSSEAGAGGFDASAGAPPLGEAGTPRSVDGLAYLGRSCRVNADCVDPKLRCLSANEDYMDGKGAPAGGLCTADCQADTDCRNFDPSALCATLGEAPLQREYATKPVARLCMLGCALGAPSGSTKCLARTDVACRPFAPPNTQSCLLGEACAEGSVCFRGACRELGCGPRCNADADCGSGRHCNAFSGLCDAAAVTPVPVGIECAGDTDTSPTCGGGNCLEIDDADGARVKRMCTQSCTLGATCGDAQGACVSPRFPNYAVGDIAYCQQKCNCDDDCKNAADGCFAWPDEETAKHFGSAGVCDYAPTGSVTLSCNGGQGAGGASGAGAGGDPSADSAGQGGAGGAR